MDMATHAVEWHEALFPGAGVHRPVRGPGRPGLGRGRIATRFFAFDPAQRKVVHDRKLEGKFGPTTSSKARASSCWTQINASSCSS